MHPLLLRQLKREGLAPDADVPERLYGLLDRISRAYSEADEERQLLDRAQELASRENEALCENLRAERAALEQKVEARTADLQLSEARLRSLLSLSVDAVWEQDEDHRLRLVSDGMCLLTALPTERLLGQRLFDLPGFRINDGQIQQLLPRLESRASLREVACQFDRPDGSVRHLRISMEPAVNAAGQVHGYRGVARDITSETLATQRLDCMARFDSLTGLPNRTHFVEMVDHAVARARRNGQPLAVALVDLDRFKTVNDTVGHAMGDELLRTMAARLRANIREVDSVARLGGDEFVLLLESCGGEGELGLVFNRLLAAIAEPVELLDRTYLLTGSVGLARFPDDGNDTSTLLRHADAAMYLAKERGKNNVQFYTDSLATQSARRFELETALRQAIARQELSLHYQPKVAATNGQLLGLEALLRWNSVDYGPVSPAEFIPVAEESGQIVEIGAWVLRQACWQMRAWRDSGLAVPPVAVNLSAHQFADNNLVTEIENALSVNQLAPADLEVELTESVLMTEPERARGVLHHLRQLGLHVTIDDFGTGYSSLAYLKRFPAGTVKLDRSFVRGLPDDSDDSAIAGAVVAMAHSLRLTVVAEGVETEKQLEALRALKCDQIQGYLTGRPVDAATLARNVLRPQ
ncbi:putative bifunctional diguanylate cyclase/phosphodiesterase [Roseateles sp.]|uniref:putative bifunctional diguanylate cyclase/phosphodiesterase n=1 Tax=Roseateles sp. TaxID=1971397 RepID=UPI003951B754